MYHNLPDPDTQADFYEGVPLKRLIAFVIDAIVIVVMSVLVLPLTFFLGLFIFPLIMAIVSLIYRTLTLGTGSATWGMRVAAIEIRAADGMRLDFQTAFLHTLGFTVSCAIPFVQLISMIMMAVSPRGQGLTDMVLGTTALNIRA